VFVGVCWQGSARSVPPQTMAKGNTSRPRFEPRWLGMLDDIQVSNFEWVTEGTGQMKQ
jgi:hypothetical protein